MLIKYAFYILLFVIYCYKIDIIQKNILNCILKIIISTFQYCIKMYLDSKNKIIYYSTKKYWMHILII